MSGALVLVVTVLAAEPLTLDRAVEVALERNADVVNAAWETDAARWSRLSTLSSAGPRVRVEGGVQRWDKALEVSLEMPGLPAGPSLSVRDQLTSSASVVVVQPLAALWPILEGLHVKDLGVDIARLKQLQARRDVTFQATESFYRVLQAQRMVQVMETSVAQVERQASKAEAFERQGLVGQNDVLRAKIALASTRQRLVQARGGEALATARLRTLLRLPAGEALTLAPPAAQAPGAGPTFVLADAQQAALAQRSELTEIEARVGQARAARRLAWSRMLPQVNALASYQFTQGQALAQKDQFFVGLSAQWDVWEWGSTYFGTREAAIRQHQAELGLERLKDGLSLDVQAAYVAWDTAREALAVGEQAVAQAEENYRIESRRYDNASNTTFDVLDAEALLTQARAQRETAWFELLIAQAGMRRAMGETDVQAKEQVR